MKDLFHFERKIGWSEVIAILAFVLSAVAVWYSRAQVMQNLPDLVIERQDTYRVLSADPKQQNDLMAIIPFTVTNRGGRTATLLRLERDEIPPLLQVIEQGVTEKHDLYAEFSLFEGTYDSRTQLAEKAKTAEVRTLKLPQILNESIDPGRARSFVLLLRVRDKTGSPMGTSKVLFSARAVFTDGTTYRLAQGFGFQ